MSEQVDITLLSRLLDDNNKDNIILFDEEGKQVELEQIAIVPHNNDVFAILRPLDADHDSAAVFKIDTTDEESIIAVEDDTLASKIIDIYNEQI